MLVGISGSQGCGKSTILSRLKDLGFNTIERKTSRSILTDWNVTLDQVNNDPNLTIKFQDEIIRRKFEDELIGVMSPDIWFTERTYADLMTYFLITLGKDNTHSNHINDYYRQCITHQQAYSKIFYLKAGHFVPENDGVRGANVHYSRMVDLTMTDFTNQMSQPDRLTVVDTPSIDQRLDIILSHCGLRR